MWDEVSYNLEIEPQCQPEILMGHVSKNGNTYNVTHYTIKWFIQRITLSTQTTSLHHGAGGSSIE